jgi:uncharacterized protein (DUF2236 family)
VIDMADLFPKHSVIRRVTTEPALLLGAGRALLLQLAHPSVAQGVADHSDFQHQPFKRLVGTLEATYAVVQGSQELADAVGRRIRALHGGVTGPGYRANDPELLLWVHATLLDTVLDRYTRLVGPLPRRDEDALYDEMATVAEVFGCPRRAQPDDIEEFREYVGTMVRTLVVSDTGRSLAADIVAPALPGRLHVPLAPALSVHRLLAVGTLPPPLREQFGFPWDRARASRLAAMERAARTTFHLTPRPVRALPWWVGGQWMLALARRHTAGNGI